ncbi:hypothetical protein GOP47_0030353 [Adiantum capillus-veneris]|nr:hypothetical protein GOP47_0030353 [Adiantum capillus-veneris]
MPWDKIIGDKLPSFFSTLVVWVHRLCRENLFRSKKAALIFGLPYQIHVLGLFHALHYPKLLLDMSSEPLLPCQDTEWRPTSRNFFKFQSTEEGTSHSQLSHELTRELLVAEGRPWYQFPIKQWSQQKVIDPFIIILRRGLEPKLLSLSAALGLALGVFPICGVPLVFCAAVALVLRSNCHVPTLMLGNFVASFFELWLVVPYMRAGELVTGGEHFPLSTGEFWEALKGGESHTLIFGMLHAIVGWSVFLPITVAVLYVSFLPIFKYLAAKIELSKFPLHQSGSHDSVSARVDGSSSSNPDSSVHV